TGDEKYLDIAKSKVEYLEKHALRFGDNVLQHTVSVNNDFPEQAWADTLFMAGFFLLRMGVLLKDEQLIDDALNQYYWHIKYLQDPATGLYYHGYNNITGDHMSGIYWGRANAWAAYTMSQVGVRLPQCYLYPKFLDVVGSLNDQLAALKLHQTENGLWRTIVNDPESYEEISASCGIAAAMITKGNPLHIKYINKAIPGVLANVTPEGKVCNVSGGTAVMKDREGYRGISRDWIQGWGQGLALAFLAGVLNYENVRSDGAL
ncbi:glycoside hydrolase family 88 protein, partial [bacterium]|nr:glycoside hydrolase family 88 protein [bacterium]